MSEPTRDPSTDLSSLPYLQARRGPKASTNTAVSLASMLAYAPPGGGYTMSIPEAPQATEPAAIPTALRLQELPAAAETDGGVDWAEVRAMVAEVSSKLREAGLSMTIGRSYTDDEKARGDGVIATYLANYQRLGIGSGRTVSLTSQAALHKAIYDSIFALGRWQPLTEIPNITDIEITGCDHVRVIDIDGMPHEMPPVAETDDELLEDIRALATRYDRQFSDPNFYRLRLDLPEHGGIRLTAFAWRTPRPVVRLRLDPLNKPTLDQLVTERHLLDEHMAAFLTAFIKTGKTIVVSGGQGSGKTTFLRALLMLIPEYESLGIMETERELKLQEVMPDRARAVISLDEAPGGIERDEGTGRRAGEITMDDLFPDTLRLTLDRIVVGEVRGPEILAMFNVMQAGAGGAASIHADSAVDTIGRIVSAATSGTRPLSEGQAVRMTAQNVDLIVHIAVTRDPKTGRKKRYVDEIMTLTYSSDSEDRIARSYLWKAPAYGAKPLPKDPIDPQLLQELVHYGFDPIHLTKELG